jgi:hypothetical protein
MSHDRTLGGDDGSFRVYSNGKITYNYRCPVIMDSRGDGMITRIVKHSIIPNIYLKGLFPLEVSNEYGTFGYAIVSIDNANLIRVSLQKLFRDKSLNEIKDDERINMISIAKRCLFVRDMALRLSSC